MRSLTENQKKFISYTLKSKYSFYERKDELIDSSWSITDLVIDLEGKMNPMVVGAMVTTLKQKNLLEVTVEKGEHGKLTVMRFTEEGKELINKNRRKK